VNSNCELLSDATGWWLFREVEGRDGEMIAAGGYFGICDAPL
jgi:hypothetical protein